MKRPYENNVNLFKKSTKTCPSLGLRLTLGSFKIFDINVISFEIKVSSHSNPVSPLDLWCISNKKYAKLTYSGNLLKIVHL